MINLLRLTINVRKSQRHTQCTLQLLCENRVLLESVFTFLYAGSSMKIRTSSSSRVPTSLSHTSLLIQPHKQKYNGVGFGYSNSCISVTIQNATRVHMNSLSQSLPQNNHLSSDVTFHRLRLNLVFILIKTFDKRNLNCSVISFSRSCRKLINPAFHCGIEF